MRRRGVRFGSGSRLKSRPIARKSTDEPRMPTTCQRNRGWKSECITRYCKATCTDNSIHDVHRGQFANLDQYIVMYWSGFGSGFLSPSHPMQVMKRSARMVVEPYHDASRAGGAAAHCRGATGDRPGRSICPPASTGLSSSRDQCHRHVRRSGTASAAVAQRDRTGDRARVESIAAVVHVQLLCACDLGVNGS